MPEISDAPASRSGIKGPTIVYIGSLYFAAVSVLYLWGYWGYYRINILEYVAISDVIKIAAYPVASFIVIGSVAIAFGQMAETPIDKIVATPVAERRPGDRLYVWLDRVQYVLMTIFLGVFLFRAPEYGWALGAVVVALVGAAFIAQHAYITALVGNYRLRRAVVVIVLAAPGLAFATGRIRATSAVEGNDYWYLISANEGIVLGNPDDPAQRVKILGHVNDYMFLLRPDAKTVQIVKFDDLKGVEMRRGENAPQQHLKVK